MQPLRDSPGWTSFRKSISVVAQGPLDANAGSANEPPELRSLTSLSEELS